MELAARFAGFCAAHAVSCVYDMNRLIPLIGFEMLDGRRHMCRVIAEMFGQAIQIGQEKLVHNPYGAARGVLVYDGFITLPSGKMDAIVLDICEYGLQLTTFLMAVPYRPNSSPEGFAVYRPKLLSCAGSELDAQVVGCAFLQGVDSNNKAALLWNRHREEGFLSGRSVSYITKIKGNSLSAPKSQPTQFLLKFSR